MSDKLPRMDYRQHRRARRLVHECCNYDEGNCLLLDDGEPCVCVQSISLSLMCRWFRVAVLPLDGELAAASCTGGAGNGAPSAARPLSPIQPGKILPRLRRTHEETQSRPEKAETKAEMSRFRAFQTRINQGFFVGVKGCVIHLSFSPGNAVLMRDKPPKSTRTQGGDTIADYIMADTTMPLYLLIPVSCSKMEISQTAKLLYSLLLDRSTLSQKNKWQDDKGRIYIIYPIAEIAEILDKGSTTIKGALNELDMAGLLERERGGFSARTGYM